MTSNENLVTVTGSVAALDVKVAADMLGIGNGALALRIVTVPLPLSVHGGATEVESASSFGERRPR